MNQLGMLGSKEYSVHWIADLDWIVVETDGFSENF
jgi:hypothetical protein